MASGPTAYAELDWTTFPIKSFDFADLGGPSRVMSNEFESSYAQTDIEYDSNSGWGWTGAGQTSEASGSSAVGKFNNTKMVPRYFEWVMKI